MRALAPSLAMGFVSGGESQGMCVATPWTVAHQASLSLTIRWRCVSDSDRRVPAELGQEGQASSCLRKGTPLASRVAQGLIPRQVLLVGE